MLIEWNRLNDFSFFLKFKRGMTLSFDTNNLKKVKIILKLTFKATS